MAFGSFIAIQPSRQPGTIHRLDSDSSVKTGVTGPNPPDTNG